MFAGLTCFHKPSEAGDQVQLVEVDTSSGAQVCYKATVPTSTSCPDLQCTRVPRTWVYSATDRASCEAMRQQQPPIGSYMNVSCCSQPGCNAPDPKLDRKAVVVTSSARSMSFGASIGIIVAAGVMNAVWAALI